MNKLIIFFIIFLNTSSYGAEAKPDTNGTLMLMLRFASDKPVDLLGGTPIPMPKYVVGDCKTEKETIDKARAFLRMQIELLDKWEREGQKPLTILKLE